MNANAAAHEQSMTTNAGATHSCGSSLSPRASGGSASSSVGVGAGGVPISYAPRAGDNFGAAASSSSSSGCQGTASGGGMARSSDSKFGNGFSFSGGHAGGWSQHLVDVDKHVASVPVRSFDFRQSPQQVVVGRRAGLTELQGAVAQPYNAGAQDADFSLVKGVLADSEVVELVTIGSKMLSDLVGTGRAREEDPSDGRPAFAVDLAPKGVCCADLAHVLEPVVQDVLSFVKLKYKCPSACLGAARFRRFLSEERPYLPPHYEHDAFVTVRFGLKDLRAITGGLFVQGSRRAFLDRRFLPVDRGDALVHQYDLYYGVEVQDGSWCELALVFKDCPNAVVDRTCPWFQNAAEAGEARAQLGWALSLAQQGDLAAARAWLKKTCEQDHPEALYVFGEMLWASSEGQTESREALDCFRRAAERGHVRAQSRLGSLLTEGVDGRVQQDVWEGKRLLRLAFEQDDPDAGFHLGQALVKEGDRDGGSKLLSACRKGHPRACFHIAEMYREGQFQFPQDIQKSLRYTKWAAHLGDALALSNLGHLIINGVGVVRDEAKAVRLFRHAAKLGAAEGQLNYGLALLRGNGGARINYQEALDWAKKSAAQGHSLAHQQLPMFFNAAKNPNPPARPVPTSWSELTRLTVRDLRELLHAEGIDFSDCVEKADLIAKADLHLLSRTEPWDPAPEHTLLLEPKSKSKDEILRQRQRQQQQQQRQPQDVSTSVARSPDSSRCAPDGAVKGAKSPSSASTATSTPPASVSGASGPYVAAKHTPVTPAGAPAPGNLQPHVDGEFGAVQCGPLAESVSQSSSVAALVNASVGTHVRQQFVAPPSSPGVAMSPIKTIPAQGELKLYEEDGEVFEICD